MTRLSAHIKLTALAQMCFSDSDGAQGGALKSTACPPSRRKCLRRIDDAPAAPLMYVAVHTVDRYQHSGSCSLHFLFLYRPVLEVIPYSAEFDAELF